jgi:hypothetical protein
MAFSRKRLRALAQPGLPPLFLHQSHDFDKEEFDKEIVAPRPEFRIGRPAACFSAAVPPCR